jgi:hypothetical protein
MFSGGLQQTHPEGLLKNRSTYWSVICSRDLQSRLQEASARLLEGHLMSKYVLEHMFFHSPLLALCGNGAGKNEITFAQVHTLGVEDQICAAAHIRSNAPAGP